MANTPTERQQLKTALTLIANKYADWMTGNQGLMALLGAREGDFDVMVKFMDEVPFISNYSLGQGAPPVGCQINGFFSKAIKPFEIYINRTRASPSTLIHELLHLLTHEIFNKNTSTRLNEGVTEYFTRKVQGAADAARYPDFLAPRQSYPTELGDVNATRNVIKTLVVPNVPAIRNQKMAIGRQRNPAFDPDPTGGVSTDDMMKRAYFKGEISMINLLKQFATI
ncbi:MAG: hypothetical protein H7070_10825 [Saprospiraceae bacterium]|nr:hypothetical protein [Pyrinomonadaceae bacterium]